MTMKPKHRRLILVLASMLLLGSGVGLLLVAFQDGMVFYYTPTELRQAAKKAKPAPQQVFRIGGMVLTQSLKRSDNGVTYRFIITDLSDQLEVVYTGVLPDLFREGQGVVAEGTLQSDGVLVATTILAKHDERYMPKNLVDQLKKSGKWQEGQFSLPSTLPDTLPNTLPDSLSEKTSEKMPGNMSYTRGTNP